MKWQFKEVAALRKRSDRRNPSQFTVCILREKSQQGGRDSRYKGCLGELGEEGCSTSRACSKGNGRLALNLKAGELIGTLHPQDRRIGKGRQQKSGILR